jgi:two-component sensor histidine kinase
MKLNITLTYFFSQICFSLLFAQPSIQELRLYLESNRSIIDSNIYAKASLLKKLAQNNNDSINQAWAYYYMGIGKGHLKDIPQALANFDACILLSEQIKSYGLVGDAHLEVYYMNRYYQFKTYNLLANLNNTENLNQIKHYYELSQDSSNFVDLYNEFALNKLAGDKSITISAKDYYEKALDLASRIKDSVGYCRTLVNFMDLELRDKNYNTVHHIYAQLLLNYPQGYKGLILPVAKANIAQIYFEQEKYDSAIAYLEPAYDELKKMYPHSICGVVANYLNQAYLNINDYKKAYHLTQSEVYKNRGLNTNNLVQIHTYQQERSQQIHAQELREKEYEQRLAQQKSTISLSIGVSLSLILVLISFFLLKQQESNKKLLSQKKLVESLLKELHHRVKNNLQLILNVLEFQIRNLNIPTEKELLKDIRNRIRSIAIMHQQLAPTFVTKETEELDLNEYINQLCQRIAYSYDKADNINWSINSDAISIPFDKALILGIILNELITNSIKHGLINDQGNISVSVYEHGADLIVIVADEGKGYPPNMDIKELNSMGIALAMMLTKQIKGELILNNRKGAQSQIILKKKLIYDC